MSTNIKKIKEELLEILYLPYKKCMSCPLATQGRTHVVFGEGNADARIMLIGEAPGAQEDELARPFVGASGKLLTHLLQKAGISRPEIFITNIVKCRPPNNRRPTPQESGICKNILLKKQIEIIQPTVIGTLGSCALEELLEGTYKITQVRGKKLVYKDTITVIPTYHPAYILRNRTAEPDLFHDLKTIVKLAE